MKLPISLVVVTLNEEKNIERCLKSAPWADEFLVLDSGSHDRTLEIAQKLGAKVSSEPWKGFGPQKFRAVELAKNDWVFCIDADEEVSLELSQEILQKFSQWQAQAAFRVPRKSFYLGRWILHGGWYPDAQTRIFHREFHQWNQKSIHESVETSSLAGKIETLQSPLHHYVFKDVEHQVATNNRYSSLQAKQFLQEGGRFSMLKMLFKPVGKFIECYFFKLGLLDGLPGFIIAVGAGYSVFIRWAKIWQLSQSQVVQEVRS